MEILLKIAVLLAVMAGTSASRSLCSVPEEGHLDCSGKGLSFPPSGLWPNVTKLILSNNTITKLPTNSLAGFPDLEELDLSNNSFTNFQFGATNTNLTTLGIQNNKIETLTPPPRGTTFPRLRYINARNNRISDLDRDFFLFAPNLWTLNIKNNPLIVVPGHPVLNHLKLRMLFVSFGGTGLNVADSTLLAGLPNLTNVGIFSSNISSVEGAFVSNKRLGFIYLKDNAISQITPGIFRAKRRLWGLYLSGNPLNRLEPAALNNTLARGAMVDISDTPLACECRYEALYTWAKSKTINIGASCGAAHRCSFT